MPDGVTVGWEGRDRRIHETLERKGTVRGHGCGKASSTELGRQKELGGGRERSLAGREKSGLDSSHTGFQYQPVNLRHGAQRQPDTSRGRRAGFGPPWHLGGGCQALGFLESNGFTVGGFGDSVQHSNGEEGHWVRPGESP